MFLLVAWMWTPESRPTCIKDAKTRPILEAATHIVQFILPGDAKIDIDGTDEGVKKPDAAKDDLAPQKPEKSADDLKQFQAPATHTTNDKIESKTDDAKPDAPTEPAAPVSDKTEKAP